MTNSIQHAGLKTPATDHRAQVDPAFNHDSNHIQTQIRAYLNLTRVPGEVFEVRVPNATDGRGTFRSTWSGYYSDIDKAVENIARIDEAGVAPGIYVTLNPAGTDLLARCQNNLQFNARHTTKDDEITQRRLLLIDLDPKRPAGVSSTDEELARACECCDRVVEYLTERGWPQPLKIMSGNGYHAQYRIDLPADDGDLVKRVLHALAQRFSDDRVDVDKAVHNAARISKIPGTMTRKGDAIQGRADMADRPHRRSHIVNADLTELKCVPREKLEELAGEVDAPVLRTQPAIRREWNTPPSVDRSLPQLEPIEQGCAFIRHCRDDSASLDEPQWYAMLGIVGRCEDGEHHAQALSQGHPGYDADKTAAKLRHAVNGAGPRTCENIERDLGFTGCAACPHRGRIKSPIVLGGQGSIQQTGPEVYWAGPDGMYRQLPDARPQRLTNFVARIEREVTVEEGQSSSTEYEIMASVSGQTLGARVSAGEFARLDWVAEQLKSNAISYVTGSTRGHIAAAIQTISRDKQYTTCYRHTGWRKIDGRWMYLHGGGAIDENGPVDGILTELTDQLKPTMLIFEEVDEDVRQSIRSSLELIDMGPDHITVPLLGAVYLSVLGPCGVNVHLMGKTGVFKSQLAVIAQAHFGAGYDDTCFPASWKDTGYALMKQANLAKDMLMVVDDFKPIGPKYQRDALVKAADDLFRGNANCAGRSRLTRDAQMRHSDPPQSLILSTGEDSPGVHSIQARVWEVPVRQGEVRVKKLSQAQQQARAGTFARAMGSYVSWLAGCYDQTVGKVEDLIKQAREQIVGGTHARTRTIAAGLWVGWVQFLSFAVAVGAIGQGQAETYLNRALCSLNEQIRHQDAAQAEYRPAERFIELIRTGLSTGKAHLVNIDGERPEQSQHWGWADHPILRRDSLQPQGEKIGWVDRQDVYLDMDQAMRVVREIAPGDDALATGARALRQHLGEAHLLVSTEQDTRGTYHIRKTCEGRMRSVIHLKAQTLAEAYQATERIPCPV